MLNQHCKVIKKLFSFDSLFLFFIHLDHLFILKASHLINFMFLIFFESLIDLDEISEPKIFILGYFFFYFIQKKSIPAPNIKY